MVNSWRSAEIIDNARHHNAYDPKEKIEIDEPRFKGRLHGNDVRFQQRKHSNEENAGEHVRNQFCHAIKIIQIKNNSCKKSEKRRRKPRPHSPSLINHCLTTAYCLLHPPFFRL